MISELLWTSPELLRHELPTKGSHKGDVYSFGVLIEEILSRSTPYQEAELSSKGGCDTSLKPLYTFGKQYCPSPTLRVSQLIYKTTNL